MTKRKDPLDTAKRKGLEAYLSGKTEDDCPYADVRTAKGQVTWSRAYMRAWLAGFREAKFVVEVK